ncbi:MAG: efflux RND transporter periplasmic adaptor subunit [Candidatus Omnitrophota bacterium]|nr:efflux RND transporter periplasmic adaptor subunit [Candidatus Omnitrophota bacterium]
MKRAYTYLLAVFLTAAFVTGCGENKEKGKYKEEPIPVKVMKIKAQDLDKALEYVGNIQGEDEAQVYPKVSGKIIEKVKREGDFVSKGDVIAYIDRDEVGLKFEKAPVESPLVGVVGRVYVDIGSSVNTATPVALVANLDRAEIHLDIPEKYLPNISLAQDADITVDAYPGEKFLGKVTMISPIVDLQTRAAPIEIKIENADHRLQSGMFAKVKLVIEEQKNRPVILKEAIIGRGANTYVYIVDGKRAFLKNVILGIRQGPYYGVESGLKTGDKVVIVGQQRLRDGCLVEPEE